MSNIIPFQYGDMTIRFNTEGWINATEIAKAYGKRLDHWLENKETQSYLKAIGKYLNTPDSGDLIQARRGNGGGTWLHPKLAVVFARWLDVDFAVWCDLQVDALIRGDSSLKQQYDLALKALQEGKEAASFFGKGLNSWKRTKPELEHRVQKIIDKMQMNLPFSIGAPIQGCLCRCTAPHQT
ncbi:KilA-N domain-containing protein [Zymobacter palmae]|nr:KilA-N domain-containing protein [Zymobacter palmae]